jgi:hypothetical protein
LEVAVSSNFLHAQFADHDFLPGTPTASYPFKRRIGLCGNIAVFDEPFSPSEGLARDLEFLSNLELGLGRCAYGACDCPLYPFISHLATSAEELCAADILTGLQAKNFQSDHVRDLQVKRQHYPGYKPGTLNDEIHNDFESQYVFPKETDKGVSIAPRDGTHGELLRYVSNGHLWYVLLHIDPYDFFNGVRVSEWVFLFAVGHSPNGSRLVGLMTNQACHNLCD